MSDVHAALDDTIDSAVDVMPDIDELEVKNGDRLRDDVGRFAKAQEEAGREQEETEKPADDAEDPAKEAADETTDEDDEDYFELPPAAEGEEPQRLKATDVFEGYQRAQELEAELANVKASTPPPPDYDRAIMEAVESGTKYVQGLQQIEMALQTQTQMPDQALLDINSAAYDPEAYNAQLQFAQQQHQRLSEAKAERERAEQEVNQRQEAVERARVAREQQKLFELWPEVKEEATANKIREDASKYYGIDSETMNSVHDARFYALLKDALAFKAQSAAQETAVKVVKAKPKLVKGKARTGTPAQRRASNGMSRLQQSGDIDDAVEALDGLF